MRHLIIGYVCVAACLSVAGVRTAAQNQPAPPAASDGEAVYRTACATCHEAGVPRAGNRATLARMSADNILFALTQGTMRAQASSLSPAQVDAVVRFLAGDAAPSAPAAANNCPATPTPSSALAAPHWNGWGVNLSQHRFQPGDMARLTANQVPSLKLKWAFGFPGVRQAYGQPTIVGGRIFVGSAGRKVYSLDAKTGCQYWVADTAAPVRAAITIAIDGAQWTAYVADQAANMYALNALTGSVLWQTKVDSPNAVITGAPALAGGTLYVGTSSAEEGSAVNPRYECCKFRGSVTALDAKTGSIRWKTYTIPEAPAPTTKSPQGVQLWGPAGAAVWSSPTVDLQAKRVYVTTGDGYSDPVARTTDAFIALDLDTGKMLWSRQLTENDSYTMSCGLPSPLSANCPQANGPDHDFGSSPILIDGPNNQRALIAGQKSSVVHALNPDTGEVLWQTKLGQGGRVGGVQWGSAFDGTNVYAALSDVAMGPPPPGGRGGQPTMLGTPLVLDPKAGGGLFALNPRTGAIVWKTPHPGCGDRLSCSPAQSAAVTAIPGVVFSGGLDGHLRGYAASDGKIIWDVDTVRDYETVNGVKATGGALDGPGAVVVDGMLYVNSGYAFIGGIPGNVLLAFSIDGR
jgi:polyvinyl alcohol dehydrogenase (cytochrome)